ncbi:hypothetical protein MTsPCn5_00410 [Croceitalea sp. MTPC5]|uniref:nitroreductase family protein n=1 Tax=Croceitalea sp. MTPC5 TaxID=3056565 RepID=UPI002B38688B|nr:hypothetical protein MTsPCn5_00410 [Croceitalea sp. MTPC5]
MTLETIIKKEAKTDYKLVSHIENRWSPRTFSDIPISSNDIKILLEAGRWAASSFNLQPWMIFWGTKGSKAYDMLFDCMNDFNQSWAKSAPLLVATAYNTKKPDGKDNFHALHDLGLFMGNMGIQAQSMGIGLHHMAGFDFEKAKRDLQLPDEYHVATMVALGFYGGTMDNLNDELKEQELNPNRERKPIAEFAFNGAYVDRAQLDT